MKLTFINKDNIIISLDITNKTIKWGDNKYNITHILSLTEYQGLFFIEQDIKIKYSKNILLIYNGDGDEYRLLKKTKSSSNKNIKFILKKNVYIELDKASGICKIINGQEDTEETFNIISIVNIYNSGTQYNLDENNILQLFPGGKGKWNNIEIQSI